MLSHDDLDRLNDTTAYAEDGEKIGTVDTVYVDDETGEGTFVLVNTGMFGMRSSFVPLEGASLNGDELRVPFSKETVKDAPNLDPDDGHIEPAQEQELFRYYGLSYSGGADTDTHRTSPRQGADAPTDDRDRSRDRTSGDTGDAMTRSEEELEVGTQQRETGRVRLRKHVVTENVTKTVPVQREEVHVEREPITDGNVDDATSGPELTEDEHVVTLHEEEPVVQKRTVPKERVRVDKDVHTDQEQVSEEVAHEEIDLVDEDATSGPRRDR
jgi:uncharacterized protein (TIGR02271 family)